MIDYYYQLRYRMIETMQSSLRQIRQMLGFGVQEFGDLIGLTRQTINNLETQKNKMSPTQYVSICAVIDNCIKNKPELLTVLTTILRSAEDDDRSSVFEALDNGSLLKKWFQCFPDESKMLGLSMAKSSIIEGTDVENIAENYRIFLDASVFLAQGFSQTIQPLSLALKNRRNQFIVPFMVIEEIQHQMLTSSNDGADLARNGMNLLIQMQREGLVDIRGEKSDVNIISTFVSVFAKFKCVHRLVLITCDKILANQILMLNNDALGGFNILVLKYTIDKGLQKWEQENDFNQQTSAIENKPCYGDEGAGDTVDAYSTRDDFAKKLIGWETIN